MCYSGHCLNRASNRRAVTILKATSPVRIMAIGDIHGQLDMLNRLLNIVEPKSTDQFVFLGDYIDRGQDSCGVIDKLIEFKSHYPEAVFIRGNHDQLILDALVEVGVRQDVRLRDISVGFREYSLPSDLEMFLSSGGDKTLCSYGLRNLADLQQDHIAFLENTKLWWRCEPFVFVHAGIERDIPLGLQDPYVFLWSRLSPAGINGEVHVVGHNPTVDGAPYFEDGRYHLDTGAVYGQTLTACDVLTRKVWQVR